MNLLESERMDKSVMVIGELSEQGDDKAYWATKTPDERLAALELMRQVMFGYDPSTARIQRVLTIAQCPWC